MIFEDLSKSSYLKQVSRASSMKRLRVYFLVIVVIGAIVCALNSIRIQNVNTIFSEMTIAVEGKRNVSNRTATVRGAVGDSGRRNKSGFISEKRSNSTTTSSQNSTDLHKRALNFVKALRLVPLSDPSAIWPEMDHGIRLTAQLQHVPKQAVKRSKLRKLKLFLLWGGFKTALLPKRNLNPFLRCPINTCEITEDRSKIGTADVIVIERPAIGSVEPSGPRPKHQVQVMLNVESPLNTPLHYGTGYQSSLNWTVTYRRDSTIPVPYGVFVRYNESVRFKVLKKNYAAGKTKKVAWFISNCYDNNERLKLAEELSKYISVDIYGKCGTLKCPRSLRKKCFHLLDSSYKFYLAFENSNCREYITEKFFLNGLSRDIVPIVYGAHKDDYERVAPPHSFIHVDDFESPKQLAEYLHRLDKNDHLYNSYFRWKGTGKVFTGDLYFWCRLCMLSHADDADKRRYVSNYDRWWRPEGICKMNSGYQRWTSPTYGTLWS
ncbi:glycoprotein 3-alpha-L-fucosyltransferase A-like [Tubulanus polymorphus]|uniref:glycoprotein 3-alpha-L-fucosyltransferase A-like n=1 Tax=Tubulanus polymorphus TaxID=672921 RepID=UPI003DA2E59B